MQRSVPARDCLDEDELLSIASGGILPGGQEAIDAHVATCDACAALVAHLARERVEHSDGAEEHAADALVLGAGAQVGRYLILALAGLGAMGRVYSAWDPELDRKVALKLLPPERGDEDAQERLRREAQAMAKLSHGNVVAVHDVGTWDGGRFLAMEFVEGQTLHSWLRAKPRRWQDIVAAFVQAGRGLAAAHAAGFVHRDFKPTNVLVRNDGRVAVTDFGLARSFGIAEPGTLPPELRETAESIVAGTPAYMAPEQIEGKELDARTDIYSFCVALYEALWARHPFSTASPEALVEAVRSGQLRPPPASKVPAKIRRAVLDGLARDPANRPASFDELLARLHVTPRGARIAAVAAAVAVLAGVAVLIVSHRGAAQDCLGAETRLAGVWDASRRDAIRAAFANSAMPGADQMSDSVLRSLDAYSERWKAGWVDACQATRVHGSQSEALMDARMLCLDDRARTWAAVVDGVVRAEPGALEKAVAIVAHLASPDTCADPRHLERDPAPTDTVTRARFEALRQQMANLRADVRFNRVESARAKIAAGLAEARALHSLSLEAELVLESGANEDDPNRALPLYHQAAQTAERAGREDLVANAHIGLVAVLGWNLTHTDEALQWADYAQSTIDHLGDEELSIHLAATRSQALERGHQLAKALPLGEKVLAYRRAHAKGPDYDLARALNMIAILHADLYHVDVALDYFRQAVAMYEQLYGPDSVKALTVKGNLGAQLRNAARSEESRAVLESVRIGEERALGRDALQLASVHDTLGRTYGDVGRFDEAIAEYRRALDITDLRLGPHSAPSSAPRCDLSRALTAIGRVDDALAEARRALEDLHLPADSKDTRTFYAYSSMGAAYEEMGRCEDALAAFHRAEDPKHESGVTGDESWLVKDEIGCLLETGRVEAALTAIEAATAEAQTRQRKDNLFHAEFLVPLARARLEAGKAPDALEPAKQAVATYTAQHVVGAPLAKAQLVLAQVMWEVQPDQRPQAVALAREALANAQPLVHTKDRIARWLKNR